MATTALPLSGANAHAPRIPVVPALRVSLVALALFGTYTNMVGAGVLGGYAIAAGLLLLLLRPARAMVYRAFTVLGLLFGVIYVAGPWINEDITFSGAQTGLQTFAAIVAAYGVGRELVAWRTSSVAKLALISTLLVLAAGFGELHIAQVKSASDTFRAGAYEGLFLYDADARDQALHGAVRPKIFTQEPSHPAKFVAVMIAAWFLLASRRKWTGLLLLFGAAAYVLRAPSLLICPAVIALGLLVRTGRKGEDDLRQWLRVTVVVGLFLAIVSTPAWIGALPFERFEAIGRGDDASALTRIDAPLQATMTVLGEHPAFGLGLRTSDESRAAVRNSFSSFQGISTSATDRFSEVGWGNGLFHLIAFTGIVGFALVLAWIVRFSRWAFGMLDAATVVAVVVVVLSLEGTFSFARPWFYIFLLLAVCAHRQALNARGGQLLSNRKARITAPSQSPGPRPY